MKKRVLYIFIFFFLFPFALKANEKDITVHWQYVAGASGYYVEIYQDNQAILKKKTYSTFVKLSLPEGDYKMRVSVYNKFSKVASVSSWENFSVRKSVTPKIQKIYPRVVVRKKASEKIVVSGKNFEPGSTFYVYRNQLLIPINKIIYKNPETVELYLTLTDVKNGPYNIKVVNKSGKEYIKRNACRVVLAEKDLKQIYHFYFAAEAKSVFVLAEWGKVAKFPVLGIGGYFGWNIGNLLSKSNNSVFLKNINLEGTFNYVALKTETDSIKCSFNIFLINLAPAYNLKLTNKFYLIFRLGYGLVITDFEKNEVEITKMISYNQNIALGIACRYNLGALFLEGGVEYQTIFYLPQPLNTINLIGRCGIRF